MVQRIGFWPPAFDGARFGRTGIEALGSQDAAGYSALHASIRAGLTSIFEGPGGDFSSTPDEVARVCLDAHESAAPIPRYVVGAMAETLIKQRVRDGDEAWDRFLETLYARPGADSRDTPAPRCDPRCASHAPRRLPL